MELEPTGKYDPNKARFGRKQLYDYDFLLNGNPHYLRRGTDYSCETNSLRVNIHKAAKENGKSIRYTLDNTYDGILFQAYPKGQNPPILPSLPHLRREADPNTPRCRVCNNPLNGLSLQAGECQEFNGDYNIVPVHTNAKN